MNSDRERPRVEAVNASFREKKASDGTREQVYERRGRRGGGGPGSW